MYDHLEPELEATIEERYQRAKDKGVSRAEMHFVKDVVHVSESKLLLIFEDDSVRLVDLKNELDGQIFEPLKDINYFKTVRVDPELDTIVWENGADMVPEFLYEIWVAGV